MKTAQTSIFLNAGDEKIVSFIGGGGKSTLIHLLSKELGAAGEKIVILSVSSSVIPLEAHTLISSDIGRLKTQLKKELESASIVYIGKKLSQDHLESFSRSELNRIISAGLPADRVFIEADSTGGRSVSGYSKAVLSLPVDRVINVLGSDAFNKEVASDWIISRDPFWKKRDLLTPKNVYDWIESREILNKLNTKHIPSSFFLNKVENIFTQNMAHSFGKMIKQRGFDRVIIGSVFNSQFQAIE
jgi:hypothetical protein